MKVKLTEQNLSSMHKLDCLEDRFIDRAARFGAALIYKQYVKN